ncbi:hypothetical protein DFH07DRAFT_1068584 [Mycena maculata]|uniref:Uncharacterized protein n=1 Tax=Mycena maculata TaxID=230809 RepID=A0AAD7H8F5_9AGAR|nr:hypothetical protein DFH07DRAFT_1068584 [Mycena maculata]
MIHDVGFDEDPLFVALALALPPVDDADEPLTLAEENVEDPLSVVLEGAALVLLLADAISELNAVDAAEDPLSVAFEPVLFPEAEADEIAEMNAVDDADDPPSVVLALVLLSEDDADCEADEISELSVEDEELPSSWRTPRALSFLSNGSWIQVSWTTTSNGAPATPDAARRQERTTNDAVVRIFGLQREGLVEGEVTRGPARATGLVEMVITGSRTRQDAHDMGVCTGQYGEPSSE